MPIVDRDRCCPTLIGQRPFIEAEGRSRSRSTIGGSASRPMRIILGLGALAAMAALQACTDDGNGLVGNAAASTSQVKPTINLQLTPNSIDAGQTVTLQWSAPGAQSCTASGSWSGPQSASGIMTVTPSATTTAASTTETEAYTLTCTGPGGSVVETRQVVVNHKKKPPVVTLSASPTTVSNLGESTLTWNATGATQCSGSGGWKGNLPISGTWSTGQLTNNTEYEVTCSGSGGSASQSVNITVSAAAPEVKLSVNPSTVAPGGSATLAWSSTNATACTASGAWSGSRVVSSSQSTGPITANSIYTLTCTGLGGSASQSATVSVAAVAPTVSVGANPSTLTKGGSSTLSWSSTNATACTASGAWSGSKAPGGSQSTGAVQANSTFTLNCSGPGGNASQSTTVSVKSPVPTVNLSVGPSAITSGGTATLTWSSSNATTCSASNGWSGTKATSGSQSTGALTTNATYTLTCTGPGGNATQSATVSVKAPAPTVALRASPSSITSGASATLTWTSTNATSCAASGAWSGSRSVTSSQSTGALTANQTYILTCTGAGGSATQSATVTVTAVPAPTVSLGASPSTVASGSASTLSWSSTNAASCTASGGWSGSKAATGSQSTGALSANATYTLTCTNSAGTKATQSTTVSVTQPAPKVALSVSPSTITSGNSAMLTWSSSNATACTASGGWSGSMAMSGSKSTGALKANTSYSLTCTGVGGSATQSASVGVTPATPAPAVTLSASPSTVTSGGSSMLSWSSTNATSCTASGGWSGSETTSGSKSTGALTANTSYTVTCTGTGGSATQSATITVTKPAPTVTLSVSPGTVASGASSTLSWSSTYATSCTASGGWSGSEATSSSKSTGALTANTSYTLTCTGAGGTAAQSATVTVTAPLPTVTLSASPSTIASGAASTLTWSSTNATACTASGAWSGSKATSGSSSTGGITSTSSYTLTCNGAGGSAANKATVTVTPTLTISGTPASTATVGSPYSFTPTVGGGSGGTLSFTIQNPPSWATFNKSTGQLSGTPASGNVGASSGIIISVSNGTTTVALASFTITVAAASTAGFNGQWFAPNSVWNTPIPAGAFDSPQANSAAVVSAYMSYGGNITHAFAATLDTWTAAVIVAPAGTPTISYTFSYAGSGSWTFPQIPLTGSVLTAVQNAITFFANGGDTDRAVVIYSEDQQVFYNLYASTASGNSPISIITGTVFQINGPGWWSNYPFGNTVSAGSAAGASYAGGMIRPSEWAAGVIDHALAGAWPGPLISGASVYPARTSDGYLQGAQYLPEGARLQLDPSLTDAQLQALGVSTAMLPICHALQTYGWYNMDQQGNFSTQIKFQSGLGKGSSVYPGATSLPMALMNHIHWIASPSSTAAPALGTPATAGPYLVAH
jgi:trimeric autotransporter adhesin